ncbi:MAG TPA: hypothetical protein VN824_09795, partial [Puia sp.]|nr:hypothetical protein [Puia sp.]
DDADVAEGAAAGDDPDVVGAYARDADGAGDTAAPPGAFAVLLAVPVLVAALLAAVSLVAPLLVAGAAGTEWVDVAATGLAAETVAGFDRKK